MHENGSLLAVWANTESAGSDLSPLGLVGLALLLIGASSAVVGSRSR
jgi:hypothetical protein